MSIGPHTSDVLREHGVSAGMIPQDDYSSYGVVSMLSELVSECKVMLVRSDSGSDVLKKGLEGAGADVTEFQSYRLEEAGETPELLEIFEALESGGLDVVAFTSPMSAAVFIERMRSRMGNRADSLLDAVRIAAIGRPTSIRLSELGHAPQIVPCKTTFRDMLEACLDYSGNRFSPVGFYKRVSIKNVERGRPPFLFRACPSPCRSVLGKG